jgi:deazaflavin-dependent oxidoreductase (nitroreductase family)
MAQTKNGKHDSGMTESSEPAGTRRPRTNPLRALSLFIEPIARPLAGSRWLPLWAVLQHTGRTSGKAYRTPVVTFRSDRGFVIPLPFGDQTQWAKNLLASDSGSLRWKGRDWLLRSPAIVETATARPALGPIFGRLVGLVGIRQFVLVEDA